MGLSNESQTQALANEARLRDEAIARGQAKALAKALINFERNPEPHPERNVENPATAGVVIRKWSPRRGMLDYRAEITEEVKRHNDAVSNLRKP